MSRTARLGLFIVGALALLAAGIFIVGSREYLFRSTYELKTQFDNVAGLRDGADVQVGGVHSGTVRSVQLPHNSGDKVTVTMDLDRSTRDILKKDSVASIETEGLLGNEFVAISFGSADQPEVKNGEMIRGVQPLLMADLLKKVDGILNSSQQAIANTTELTAHLNSISAKIDSGEGTVGALVNDKQLYTNLEQTTTTLHGTMLEAKSGVTDFQEDMEALKHNFLLKGFFKKRGYENSSSLTVDEISAMPQGTPLKTFTFTANELFDGRDSAKLKDEKSLDACGEYLAQNQFGYAVVTASTGSEGDSKKDLVLTEARAMIVRRYLVNHFGFDDTQLKTLGMGKQLGTAAGDWGSIQILIYPEGAAMPVETQSTENSPSPTEVSQPPEATAGPDH